MSAKEIWLRRYKIIKENWLSSVAVLGLLLVGVCWLIPGMRQYYGFYIAVCCYAVALLVLDLRVSSAKLPTPRRYFSLHEASTDIGETMRRAMKRRRKETLEIRIIAGRMNTIAVMLNSLAGEIQNGTLSCHRTHVTVLCVDPSYLRTLQLPNVRDSDTFQEQIRNYVESIEANSRTLLTYNSRDTFKAHGVSIDVYHYQCLPTCYAVLIGKEAIYWGYYTWDEERSDFDGPTNPCYHLDPDLEAFDDFYDWHFNRSDFLMATGTHYASPARAAMTNFNATTRPGEDETNNA